WQIERIMRRDELSTGFLAADQLQILVPEHRRERSEARLRPLFVGEMAVTTGALHPRAEEKLPEVRRALQRVLVRVIQNVTHRRGLAEDVQHGLLDEPFLGWIDELADHHVVRAIGLERFKDPWLIIAMQT